MRDSKIYNEDWDKSSLCEIVKGRVPQLVPDYMPLVFQEIALTTDKV